MTAKETRDRTTPDGVGETASRPPEPPHRPVTAETMFELLSNRDRRLLLSELVGSGGTASVAALVDCLLAQSDDTETDGARMQFEISVWHVHLPKLRAAGVVSGGEADDQPLTLTVETAFLSPFLDLSMGVDPT